VWDIKRDEVKWSGDAAPLVGLPPGKLSGRFRDYLGYVHPLDREHVRAVHIECLKGLRPAYSVEQRVTWPDGTVRWLEIHGCGRYDGRGRAVALLGIVKDITEPKEQGEQRLRQSEAKYAAIFATSPNAIAVSRQRDSVLLEVNDAWERCMGYRRAAVVGRSALELGVWENSADRLNAVARLAAGRVLIDYPTRFVRADRRAIDVLLSGATVELDGEPCVVWSWHDVTELQRAETQARQSLRKFSTLFETNPEGIVVTRPHERRIVEINDTALRIMGVAREEAIGAVTTDIVRWEDPTELARLRAQAIAGERIVRHPLRFERRDGRMVECLISGGRVEIDGVEHLVVSLQDVSAQRRIEHAHAETERRYRTLFDEALEAIVVISPEGTIVEANPAVCRYTGYPCEEIVGHAFTRLLDPAALTMFPGTIAEIFAHGSIRVELNACRKDGSLFPVEIRAGRLPDGNVLAFVRDISERKRSEQLLIKLARGVSAAVGDAFFRSLVRHLCSELEADYAFIGEFVPWDPSRVRTRVFCKDGAEAPDFEYALADSPCAHALSQRGTVVYPEHVSELFPNDVGLKALGVEGYVVTPLVDSRGDALGVLVVMSRRPVKRRTLWVSVLEIFAVRAAAEIERARAEAQVRELNVALERRVRERTTELEMANKELESFSYSVSHDLRAPLRAIGGFAELLRKGHAAALDSEGMRLLGTIDRSVERMGKLIDDLLEFSRTARVPLAKRTVDMHALVESVLGELRETRREGVRIILHDLPAVEGDASLLRQVWVNLLTNALKFTSRVTAPRIEIGVRRGDHEIEFFVSDNGAGFDARYADRLFGVFQRLHSSNEFDGTGVGLAVVQRIVVRHGGSVAADGAPDQGAKFRFTLPA